jgi:hypothetical protein
MEALRTLSVMVSSKSIVYHLWIRCQSFSYDKWAATDCFFFFLIQIDDSSSARFVSKVYIDFWILSDLYVESYLVVGP